MEMTAVIQYILTSAQSFGSQNYYRVSQKICQNPARTKTLFWIYLLDVQGVVLVHIYVLTFFDNKRFSLYVLSEVTKRKTVDSYRFVITVLQNATIFTFYYVLNTIKGNFKTM